MEWAQGCVLRTLTEGRLSCFAVAWSPEEYGQWAFAKRSLQQLTQQEASLPNEFGYIIKIDLLFRKKYFINIIFKVTITIMSAPTVSSLEADAIMDRATGRGCTTTGGRGAKKVQLTKRQREQLAINTKKNAEKEIQQKKANKASYLTMKQQSEAGLLAEF